MSVTPLPNRPNWIPSDPDSLRDEDRTTVILGNSAPMHQVEQEDGSKIAVPHPYLKQSETRVVMEPEFDNPDRVALTASTGNDRIFSMIHRSVPDEHKNYAIGLAQIEQFWGTHSGNAVPDWVYSSDPNFAQAISKHFDGCRVVQSPPSMLFTSVGRDALHQQHLITGTQPAVFQYMALTASVTAPASTDTTLTGEITTASGGLVRAAATMAHTTGTNTTTATKTFTANSNDSLPVTIAQIGIFNATSVGTLAYHTALNSTATLSTSGDNVTITETVTAG